MSEDLSYTVHTDTLVDGEPTHSEAVVLACHPGSDQGVTSPQPLSVECGTDGKVTANWESVGASRFEVEGDLQYEGISQNKSWDATPLASYTIRVRALWDRFQQDPVTGPWTISQTATCPRFAPQDVSAECTHGVVKVSWDKIAAAGNYRINGPAELVGSTGRQDITAHGNNPQATRRSAYWYKNEGDTFNTITVQAHMNDDWSTESAATSVECDPFDPDPPGTSMWESPNAIIYPESPGTPRTVLNPDLYLDSHTCGTRTTTTTGSTRTCTATWYEASPITLTAKHHGSGRTVNHGASEHLHLRRDSATSPYYASLAPHRHCDTETGLKETPTSPCGSLIVDGEIVDGDIEIIAWHPALDSAARSLWEQIIIDVTIGTSIGILTGGTGAAATAARAGFRVLLRTLTPTLAGVLATHGANFLTRTSDVNVNVMPPNCLASSHLHDGDTWVRQSRSSLPVPESPVPDPSTAYVPIRTQTEYDGHITIVNHTIDYCAEATN